MRYESKVELSRDVGSQTAIEAVDRLVRQWEEQDGEGAVFHWAGLT